MIKLPNSGNVVIIGYAASGKSTFTNLLKKEYPRATVYHTDDYIKYGFEEALYVLMDDLRKDNSPLKIIEGILAYRLLRKGAQLGTFNADLIIKVTAPKDSRYFRIEQRGKDIKATFNLDKVCDKIYNDYVDLIGQQLPPIEYHDNE